MRREKTVKHAKFRYTLVALLLFTGCGSPSIDEQSAPEALANSTFVVNLAVDNRTSLSTSLPKGALLFYDATAQQWSALETEGAIETQAVYHEDSLYFFDYKNNYILNSQGLHTEELAQPGPHIISHAFPVGSGEEAGVFVSKNIGFSPSGDSYQWEFSVVSPHQPVQVHPHNQYIQKITQCEDGTAWNAIPASQLTPSELAEGDSTYNQPIYLYRSYPDFPHTKVDSLRPGVLSQEPSILVCSGNQLHFILDTFREGITPETAGHPGDIEGSLLSTYDISTQEVTYREIGGDHSTRITDDMWQSDWDISHVYDGQLWWLHGDGDIVKTDLATAQNTSVFHIPDYADMGQIGFLEFVDHYLFVFDFIDDEVRIMRYNLETETKESEVYVPGADHLIKNRQFPFSLEITNLDALLAL